MRGQECAVSVGAEAVVAGVDAWAAGAAGVGAEAGVDTAAGVAVVAGVDAGAADSLLLH